MIDAYLMNALLILTALMPNAASMRNVKIHANVPGMLTVQPETTEVFANATPTSLEIPTELLVYLVSNSIDSAADYLDLKP